MDFAAGTTDPKIGYARDGGRLIQRMAWFTATVCRHGSDCRYLGFGAFVIHVGPTVLFTQDGQSRISESHTPHVSRSTARNTEGPFF